MTDIPERVLGLIEGSGLTRRAFAEQIGLDESKLSKSLGGTRRFSSLDLARIADIGQVSVDWLITGEESALAMAARTTSGNAKSTITMARQYCTMREDLAGLGYLQPWRPIGNVPSGNYAEQGRRLARSATERLAESGRSATEADLAGAVETAFGVDVAVTELAEGFDGLATSSPAAKLIVLGTTTVPARQRFTLAHELAHLLVGDDQGVHLDQDVYDRAQARDPSEMRANAFASAVLMPEDTLRRAAGSDGISRDQFADLATELMVTPSALAYRLAYFRLIDAGTCDALRKVSGAQAASIAGRNEEFAQRTAGSSTRRPPGLLLRDTYAAYESGASTLRPYANLLGVDADELRAQLENDEEPPRFDG